jgi:hypothetical protein
MNITLHKVVRSWRTKPKLFIPGYRRVRVRDIKVRAVGSCGASLRPEIFEPLIEPAAAQSDDGVGAS